MIEEDAKTKQTKKKKEPNRTHSTEEIGYVRLQLIPFRLEPYRAMSSTPQHTTKLLCEINEILMLYLRIYIYNGSSGSSNGSRQINIYTKQLCAPWIFCCFFYLFIFCLFILIVPTEWRIYLHIVSSVWYGYVRVCVSTVRTIVFACEQSPHNTKIIIILQKRKNV